MLKQTILVALILTISVIQGQQVSNTGSRKRILSTFVGPAANWLEGDYHDIHSKYGTLQQRRQGYSDSGIYGKRSSYTLAEGDKTARNIPYRRYEMPLLQYRYGLDGYGARSFERR